MRYQCRIYSPNALRSDVCRGATELWIRTLDTNTMVGLPECVVSTMSGPLPETTQNRHTPGTRIEIKISNPAGNRTQAPGWKAWTLPYTPQLRIWLFISICKCHIISFFSIFHFLIYIHILYVAYRRFHSSSDLTLASHCWDPEFASRSFHVGFVVHGTETG